MAMLIFVIFWEWLVWFNEWPNYKMASPSDLGPAFWKYKILFFSFGWDTLWRTVVGLLLSIFSFTITTCVPVNGQRFRGAEIGNRVDIIAT